MRRMQPEYRHRRAWAGALLSVVCLAAPFAPGGLAHGQTAQRWRFQSQAHVDLWYHGLAVVGYEGFGLLPLYDRSYGARNREVKTSRGIGMTPLDSLAGPLLQAFDRDSLFEVFHFLPLYFHGSSPEAMLEHLAAVARGRPPEGVGAEVAAAVFTSTSARRWLGEYVGALTAEWDMFYRAYWEDTASDRARVLADAQRLWDEEFGPALVPFLSQRRLTGGVVFASPPVGAEGRIFAGAARNPSDNLAAVWLPSSSDAVQAVVFGLVRELCFPLVSQVVSESGGQWGRVVAERLSSYGAVRCGADLLTQYAPEWAVPYQQAFMVAADEPEDSGADFATVFPLDEELYQLIRAAIGG